MGLVLYPFISSLTSRAKWGYPEMRTRILLVTYFAEPFYIPPTFYPSHIYLPLSLPQLEL